MHPLRPPTRPQAAAGFTLLELMIAMVVVSVLSLIAYPSYADHVRRSQVQTAFAQLADFRVKLEQYYQDHRSYGDSACADADDAPAWADFAPPGETLFDFSCSVSAAGQAYRLEASGRSGSAAAGHQYRVDQDDRRRTLRFKGSEVDKACWLWKGGEC